MSLRNFNKESEFIPTCGHQTGPTLISIKKNHHITIKHLWIFTYLSSYTIVSHICSESSDYNSTKFPFLSLTRLLHLWLTPTRTVLNVDINYQNISCHICHCISKSNLKLHSTLSLLDVIFIPLSLKSKLRFLT